MAVAIGRDVAARRVIRPLPQPVPPGRHGLDPLGLGAQGDAWHAVKIGLLLQPARIGVDGVRRLQETLHVEIAERLGGDDRTEIEPPSLDLRPGARVQRQHHRAITGALLEVIDDLGQRAAVGGALGAMHGRHGIPAPREAQAFEHRGAARKGGGEHRRIVHHVADVVDALDDAFAAQIVDCGAGRAQQQRAQMVAQYPVDLLRHGAVERAQPGLEMGDRHLQLGRGEGAGKRRVGIARHQHDVGALGDDDLFEAGQHPPGHRAMIAAMDTEIDARRRDAELVEKDPRHRRVEMLAGVHEDFLDVAARADGPGDRRRLDELRPRPDHRQHPEALHSAAAPAASASVGATGFADTPNKVGATTEPEAKPCWAALASTSSKRA